MSAHTAAWSECRSPENCIDAVTCDIRIARPAAYCVRGADENARDRARQRPASTHDTGIVTVACRRHQDGEIDDAVLFGADELLAIEDEDRLRAVVDDEQFGDAALRRDLGDLRDAERERLVEREIERLLLDGSTANEREHGDGIPRDGRAEGDGREGLRDQVGHASMMVRHP